MSDQVFFAIRACVENALDMAFFDLPIMSLFAKITPVNIEGTIFAMLTGVINLSLGVLSPLTGTLIDKLFFQVTTENLESSIMEQLVWTETLMALLPLLFMWLIPLRRHISAYQAKVMFQEEEENSESKENRDKERGVWKGAALKVEEKDGSGDELDDE